MVSPLRGSSFPYAYPPFPGSLPLALQGGLTYFAPTALDSRIPTGLLFFLRLPTPLGSHTLAFGVG